VRLHRFALTIAVLLTASSVANAADEQKGFYCIPSIGGGIGFGMGFYTQDIPPLPDDWKSNFEPNGGSMEYNSNKTPVSALLNVSFELHFFFRNIVLGVVTFYEFSAYGGIEQHVARRWLSWWDSVKLQSVAIRKISPAIGFSFTNRINVEHLIRVTVSAQPYMVFLNDYRGVDVQNGQNHSTILRRKRIDDGAGIIMRLELGYGRIYKSSNMHLLFPVHIERSGKDAWLVGLSLRLSFMLKS
jgi:hypothetical protein